MIKIKDKTIRVGLQFGFLFLLGQLLILIYFWGKLPPEVPLFYSRPWGQEQLSFPFGLFILPFVSFLVILVNLIVASLIPGEEKLPSQLLIIFATVFNFFCLVTLFKIVTLIT